MHISKVRVDFGVENFETMKNSIAPLFPKVEMVRELLEKFEMEV